MRLRRAANEVVSSSTSPNLDQDATFASSEPGSGGPHRTVSGPSPEVLQLLAKTADNVAHEMTNVLAAIVGLASVVAEDLEPGTVAARDVEAIAAAGRRGLNLLKDLLAFAHDATLDMDRIGVAKLLGIVRGLLLRSVPPGTEVETRIEPDTLDVEASPILLKQALFNLGVNAAEAIKGKGVITLTSENVKLDAENSEGAPAGMYVRLRVTDTGVGMSPEVLARAFEPFFTTKPGKVRGLGLTLVSRTIALHRGRVAAFSKPGFGTVVTLDIPALNKVVATGKEATNAPPPKPGRRLVLVVDDDRTILRGATRMLQKLGYEAIAATSGSEAIESYRQNQQDIEAVLLDLVMPNEDGLEVLQEIKQIDSGASVFISSGYPMSELSERLRGAGVDGILSKPYGKEELRALLDDL